MVNASSHAARTPRFGVGSSAHEASSSRGGEPSDSRAPFPDDCCIHELFGAQVSRTPEASALVFGDQELSYRQLDERSSQLAHHLQRLGVGPDVLVGLCVERSLDAIVALLGILKAGGAYVPLDPAYPEPRLAFLLSDAAASVLVTQAPLRLRLPPCSATMVSIDADWPQIAAQSATTPVSGATADSLAYVIYTSGSTGEPKGVAMSHRPLCNLVTWQQQCSALGEGGRTLQLASLSFDVSVQEIFATLCTGGTLVLLPEALRRDPAAMLRLIARHSVGRLFLTFTALQQLAEAALRTQGLTVRLREIMTAGEQLRITPQIRAWLEQLNGCVLFNQYGPTETHVVMTSFPLQGAPRAWPELPPIGRPIANTRVHLLDEHMRPVTRGAIGEVCIGGECLARGYLNRPELTAQRFVADPFSDEPGARLYRSGDLGRFLPDGNIEFLGRVDEQVKIRGFRIELGEVEVALDRHCGVRQAAVIAREDACGDKRLLAYVVPASCPAPAAAELREFLRQCLPAHMVPTLFVALDALPTTPSGKVDKGALPAPQSLAEAPARVIVSPQGSIEDGVAAIWAKVLGLGKASVSRGDNFFELGGDSLKAARVLAGINARFGVELPYETFLGLSTVAETAACIDAAQHESGPLRKGVSPWQEEDGDDSPGSGEAGIWFAMQLAREEPIYNESFTLHLDGDVDAAAMTQALDAFIRRHDVLRTAFVTSNGAVVRQLHDDVTPGLSVVELGAFDECARADEFARRAGREARLPFDMTRAPLARASLYRLGATGCRLHVVLHHIICDAYSVYELLLPELHALYCAFRRGDSVALAPPGRFKDYLRAQREYRNSEAFAHDQAYWEKRLRGISPLALTTDRPRPPVCRYRGTFRAFSLPPQLGAALAELGRRERTTLYTLLLTAFNVLLWRYTGEDDIAVGTVSMDRQQEAFAAVFGCCLNTLVMRTDLSGDPPFAELLARVHRATLEALAHGRYPFLKLVERLQGQRDPSRHPLFQVAFVLEPGLSEHASGWTVSQLDVQHDTAKFDLLLELEQRSGGIIGRFEYNTDLFEDATIARMAAHFETLLEGIVANPDARLSTLPLLGPEELRQLLHEWNDTAAPLPEPQCIHALFEQQAARAPDAVAVVDADRILTYGELNARANQLARYLRARGVGPDVPVGLCLGRSADMVIAILGVLKAGGAYVPLDPSYPSQRLAFMLDDTRAPVLLSSAALGDRLPPFAGHVVVMESLWPRIAQDPDDNPPNLNRAQDLAYVVYTSGSTGMPKGVAVPHRGVVRLVHASNYADFGPQRAHLLLSPISFDAATFELWGALLRGGRCIVFADRVPTLQALRRAIREQGVTTLWLTAALFNTVVDEEPGILAGVEQVLTGGEALSPVHVRRALACLPATELINGYGPTEGTTFTCCFRIPRTLPETLRSVPIGRPIGNTRVYVLDPYLNPVPVGVAGELYIAGDGLARGYLNQPGLTAARFVADPFSDAPGARMYRSGDRVRYLSDGNIEFLGRLDAQLKIRGWRIEPGEIEAALLQHEAVSKAVVVSRADGDEHRIVAYFVPFPSRAPAGGELLEFLRARLPDYMLPSAVVALGSLPLTPNGKVDLAALPAPVEHALPRDGASLQPRNAIEVQLMRLWEQLLRIEPIGMEENFFDLGGHSLLAVQLMDRIARLFERELPLDVLWYGRGTIRHLAEMLIEEHAEPVWTRPIAIKSGGGRPPLFCLPIAGGHLFNYVNMAPYIAADQPLFGLPLQGVDGKQPVHTSIEDMAAHCIRQMRTIQSAGPYHLSGYCSGGVIAFEMARQLRSQGEEVAFLGLIDSIAPTVGSTLRSMLHDLVRGQQLRLVQERWYALLLNAIRLPRLRSLKGVGESHRWALWSYTPRPYAGRITVFRPASYEYSRDASLGWAPLGDNGVEVHVLPGRHRDLVKEPGVQRLAERLEQCLAVAHRNAGR